MTPRREDFGKYWVVFCAVVEISWFSRCWYSLGHLERFMGQFTGRIRGHQQMFGDSFDKAVFFSVFGECEVQTF